MSSQGYSVADQIRLTQFNKKYTLTKVNSYDVYNLYESTYKFQGYVKTYVISTGKFNSDSKLYKSCISEQVVKRLIHPVHAHIYVQVTNIYVFYKSILPNKIYIFLHKNVLLSGLNKGESLGM